MTDITITPAEGPWVVRVHGAVIAESRDALILSEAGHPAICYFPRKDVAMAFLDRTDHTTHCPKKGDASYFTIVGSASSVMNGAWSYEDPLDAVSEIRGHIAFYATDDVKIEQL